MKVENTVVDYGLPYGLDDLDCFLYVTIALLFIH